MKRSFAIHKISGKFALQHLLILAILTTMNTDINKEIRVGIVALTSLILLVAGITIGKGLLVGVSQKTVLFTFSSSGGIDIGSPLFINGVKRGSVISVKNRNGGVQIMSSIDDYSDLHADATAKISMLEITGGKKIDIQPGKTGSFSSEQEIQGTLAVDATELIALFGDLGGDAKGMVKKLDTILSQTNELLADGKVVKQLKNTIKNADEMVATLHSMVGDNKENLRTLVKDLQGLAKEARAAINNNEPKVQSLLVKLDSLADSGKRLIAKTDTAVAGANGMISDTRSVISDIKTKDGFVNKLIYDGKLSNTLDSTLLIINSFLYKVHEHGLNANIRLGTRP
ncbi:MAG: hypothetical protein RL348_1546 [Bacteroidota bacterium]|jgi:phospholipid/cholesterol/gamma-HCH transport system substrate-binding protein